MTSIADTSVADANAEFGVYRNLLIPMSDGVRLAASLYLPNTERPSPCLVSYYPYRKDDLIGAGWEYARRYLTAHGYASLLVDFRGCGSSEGVCTRTFDLRREGQDGAQVVEWAAAQDWSDGAVGVWGMSYGGCTSLAIAAEQPEHLRAIAPMYGSPDLYDHFVCPGGSPNLLGNSMREVMMLAMDLAPPTSQDAHGHWRRIWRERLARLEAGRPYSLDWPDHRDFDELWHQSTIDVEAIRVPALLLTGWNDVLLKGMVDAWERLAVPKQMTAGPWTHFLPDLSPYEPFDWLPHMRAWFDRWLRDDGSDGDPLPNGVVFFVQGAGTWRTADAWPPAEHQQYTLHLGADRSLAEAAPRTDATDRYIAVATVGMRGGMWDPLGLGIGYPADQGPDDLLSLCYETAALDRDLDIVGSPSVDLHVTQVHGDELTLVVKLTDVAPDGRSTHVATGWLNAMHRASRSASTPMPPDDATPIRIELWPTAYRVAAGHRLRLAISCSDFPRLWPPHGRPVIDVHHGPALASALTLPVMPHGIQPGVPADVTRPDPAVNRSPWLVEADVTHRISEDVLNGTKSVEITNRMTYQLPQGGRITLAYEGNAAASESQPESARFLGNSSVSVELPRGEHVEVIVAGWLTRDQILLNGRVSVEGRTLLDKAWANF